MTQICLTVAYDGTNYGGWQRQKNAVTIQEKIEQTLAQVFETQVSLTGASRTDAGVHAMGQAASFFIENCKIPIAKIPYVLNTLLPPDISILGARLVPDNFNPRFDAKEKTYRYQIWHARFPNPLLRHTVLFFPYALELETMLRAAGQFAGRHDFAAFCAAGSAVKTTVREIYDCRLEAENALITMTIRGNGFLYNMVRIIMGTLLAVGQGKIGQEEIPAIIASRDRTRAGKTVPPQGLTLMRIEYG